METAETKELILSLKGGSLEALGGLYDRFNRLVYRTAFGVTGDSEAASDLLQEVFLRLFRFASRIDSNRPLEPWLYRMTANLSYTWVKRRKWLQPIEDISDWLAGDQKTQPSIQVENNEVLTQVVRALAKLPLSQRLVVVLYYIDECSLQEIAEVLDIPTGTVKSRLHYGRLALKRYMELRERIGEELNLEFT